MLYHSIRICRFCSQCCSEKAEKWAKQDWAWQLHAEETEYTTSQRKPPCVLSWWKMCRELSEFLKGSWGAEAYDQVYLHRAMDPCTSRAKHESSGLLPRPLL